MDVDVRDFDHLSDLIRALRKRKRLSQRALATKLGVSPGYVGQWELELSQPSAEVVDELCKLFGLADTDYVRRLAYAARVPEWLRESVLRYRRGAEGSLAPLERRLIRAARTLTPAQAELLAQRVEGWVEGLREK